MLKEYFSIAEILELKLKGYSSKPKVLVKVEKENWLFRTYKTTKKDGKEYHISNFPSAVREKIVTKLLEKQRLENKIANLSTVEKIEREAYARFEIIHYVISNKLSKDGFVKEYNKKQAPLSTYDVIENITSRTLYRWTKSYETQGIEGLKSRASNRKAGKVKNIEVKQFVEGMLLGNNNTKIKNIYNALVAKAKKENLELPAYKTIVGYYRNFEKNNKAQTELARNPDGFKGKYMLAIGSYSEEAIEPNYIWEVDSTPADIMLKEGRCTILGCIDIHTRRVKFLVQKSSNSLGITSLIRNCILDWGVPRIIKSDNGADYKSKNVGIALKVLGIQQRFTNAFSGWEKPFIERVFRTTQHSHLELHNDFIGHNVTERKAIESVKTFAQRILNKEKSFPEYGIEELQNFLDTWVDNYYLNRPHDGLKRYVQQHKLEILPTPNEMLQHNINKGFKAIEVTSTRDLDLLLEPLKGKRTIGKKGIWVDNVPYFEPNPMATMVGQQVNVRADRTDMGKVYIFDEANNFICEAVNYELLGENKQEFIRVGKLIQGELTKQFKKNTKALIGKSKGLPTYGNIQIDLEEAIAEVEKKERLNGNLEYEEEITIDEGEIRFSKAMELEDLIAKNLEHTISEVDLNWLKFYQTDGEYKAKLSLMKDFEDVQEGIQNIEQESNNLEILEIGDKKWQ